MLFPLLHKVLYDAYGAEYGPALPGRSGPLLLPPRLRMADMRCRVRSMPARLSSPKTPILSTTCRMSSSVTSCDDQHRSSRPGNLASG